MNTSYAKPDTLIGTALAPLDWTRSVSLVLAFSLLNALAAQIALPIGPVPITGQTFAVLLTGALLGSRLGAAALIAYLVEGAVGLPFFAGGFLTSVAAMFVGSIVIIFVGAAWFSVLTHTSPLLALRVGVVPFIVGDIIKILLAAAVLPSGWALMRRKASQNTR